MLSWPAADVIGHLQDAPEPFEEFIDALPRRAGTPLAWRAPEPPSAHRGSKRLSTREGSYADGRSHACEEAREEAPLDGRARGCRRDLPGADQGSQADRPWKRTWER